MPRTRCAIACASWWQYLDAKYTNQTRGGITWGHFLANGGNSFPFINWGAVAIGGHSPAAG